MYGGGWRAARRRSPGKYLAVAGACVLLIGTALFPGHAEAEAGKNRAGEAVATEAAGGEDLNGAAVREAGDSQAERPPKPELAVTDEGVDGIGAQTPFDPMAVRQELPPGYTVSSASYGGDDDPLRMINVMRSDAPVLSVFGGPDGNVSLIQVLSPRVAVGPGTVGTRFGEFFRSAEEGQCSRGEDRLSEMVLCTPTEAGRVNLLFERPRELEAEEMEDEGSALPSDEALQDWRLRYVIWSAVSAPRPPEPIQ